MPGKMRFIVVVLILCTFCITYGSCATIAPTVNPECQSLADIINDLKKRLDQIPVSLLPIPGLDPTQPTTLQCYEFPNCTGFNCSGKVYGTHIQFSFNLDYCAKPVTANVTLRYPAENVTFTRTIKHSQQFFITKFQFTIPQTSFTVPVELYGKVNMVRSPGRVTVTAGIVPKVNLAIIPLTLQPFNIINNQVILVDTSRCGDEPTTSPMIATSPSGASASSVKSTTGTMKGTLVSGSATNPATNRGTIQGSSSAGAQTGNGALTGGEIAAITMSAVAFIVVIAAVVLYFKKFRITRQRHHTFRDEKSESDAKF